MIWNFRDKRTEDIYHHRDSKEQRSFPQELLKIAQRKLDLLNGAAKIEDLRIPPGNRLHKLDKDLKGFWSISVNDQWRIIFRWENGDSVDVQITDYH